MPSGDDVVLGAGNSGNAPTVIMASLDDENVATFPLGRAVLEAGPTSDPNTVPGDPFIGALGRGSADNGGDSPAMPGLAGYGGQSAGPDTTRQGGSGVAGAGGNTASLDGSAPGPGLYGIGGVFPAPWGYQYGAGVIGISGGLGAPLNAPRVWDLPAFAETGNMGVYGESYIGAGVRGQSANGDGVSGQSPLGSGVIGRSKQGTGVTGISEQGRGGAFAAGTRGNPVAQLRLTPLPEGEDLPKDGLFGDLYVRVVRDANQIPTAEMWLCLREAAIGQPAMWGSVQFGDFRFV